MSTLAPTMEGFFTERLITQRRASGNTVASYRDTLRLLLAFARKQCGKAPSELAIEDLDAELIGAFLEHLEAERHNSISTRNNRLAAIKLVKDLSAPKISEGGETDKALGPSIYLPEQKPALAAVTDINDAKKSAADA